MSQVVEKTVQNYDRCLNKFIAHCNQSNLKFDTILDVGAWVGTWSMAMEPYAKKVIAFEPDSVHFECLQRNCVLNCDARMEAVGSEIKKISLTEDNFTQAKRIDKQGDINMITLDSLQIKDVDMIKIDVEGYEMEVLKGAEKTLNSVKYLMIELNNNTKKYGSNNLEIEKHIGGLGYQTLIAHWPDKVFHRQDVN